jgi:flagellar export protein FliJ
MSALTTLARMARLRAEALQRELALLDEQRRALDTQIVNHDWTVLAEQREAGADAMAMFGAYAQAALMQRARLLIERETAAHAAEMLRATLSDAFIELKKLETLIENEVAREKLEEETRERAELDDLAGRRAG